MQARCKAKTRAGAQCGNPPITGAVVCRMHGGSSPAVRAAAQRRIEVRNVEANARAVLASEGVPAVTDPVEMLAGLAANIAATERALAARVNALSDLSYRSLTGTEQIKAEMALWGQYQDRLAKVLEALGKFNLDERRVRLAEAQGQLVFAAVQAIFNRIDLSERQWALARVAAPEELRRLTDG